MLDEEAKAAQEIAKATGKAIDSATEGGRFFGKIFGDSLIQFGGALADWARYFRYKNFLKIMDKVEAVHEERRSLGRPIPEQYALPILEAASLESEETIQNMWAGLIANATDTSRSLNVKKIFIETLRGFEPLDAKILQYLAVIGRDKEYQLPLSTPINAYAISEALSSPEEETKISLQTLARYGCIIDSWENNIECLDRGYSGFRVNNPKSNFRLSHFGLQLLDATSIA
ncbi:Abi-alpha family protein [Mangrovitalea sediminis]|uniref:Abi-alpha family protein n=1 Tax=Mangrovitalea sediminis TaxID=1982043 RepID=UPI000BE50093|nr:Abi-alpha family protein [Mangrovitalea sediminis]